MEEKTRLLWLDALKGVGILLVMVSHCFGNLGGIGSYLYACYIAIFFISAGYTYKEKPYCNYIKSRARRLLIPYFIYGIALVIIYNLLECIKGQFNLKYCIIDICGLFYSRLCLRPIGQDGVTFLRCDNSPLWFLTALFTSSILFGLLRKIKRTRLRVVIIVLFMIVGGILDFSPILFPWSLDTSLLGAAFMEAGYYLKCKMKYQTKCDFTNRLAVIFAVIMVGVYIGLVYINGDINLSVRIYGNYKFVSIFFAFIIGLLGTLLWTFFLMLCSGKFRFVNLLGRVGKISLTLLCTHKMVFRLVYMITGNYSTVWVKRLIAIVCSIIFGFVLDFIINKAIKLGDSTIKVVKS